VSRLCRHAGISRQGYYQEQRTRQRRRLQEQDILGMVRDIRNKHPRMGCRKLQLMLQARGVSIGRDRLISLLRQHKLLIERRKRYARTTDSRHSFRTYPNLLGEATISSPNEVWASDITYVHTDEGFLYLSLIMDAFSRKVVGYNVEEHLWADGNIKALRMALRDLPKNKCPIHHSDRGKQYCSRKYVKMLNGRGCKISMTEDQHCYENAMAERLNGILKQEYMLNARFKTRRQAKKACIQAIDLYNEERPHVMLDMMTPQIVHDQFQYRSAPLHSPKGLSGSRNLSCQL